MANYDVVVIGAGISGLSLANLTAEAGLETLVLEKSSRSGGCFHSHRFSGAADGFWLELGAHTCYNSYGGLLGIMEKTGLMNEILPREKVSFKMWVGERIVSITSQLSFFELLTSAWRLFTLEKKGESVSSYYSRIVGPRNFRNVFSPAFNAVISQRADDFPADMLFNKRPRRKDVIKSFTVNGGLSTITERFSQTGRLTLETGIDIGRIAKEGGIYTLELSDGRSVETKRLVLATQAPEAARLCAEIEPEISGWLRDISVETIETVGVAVEKAALKLPPLAGIIAADDSFYSAVSRDTVPHEKYRGFSFHFKAGRLSEEEKLQRIAKVLGVGRDALQQPVLRENRLPSPVVGHDRLIGHIEAFLVNKNLFMTGNYFVGMAIEDCVSRSMKEFRRISGTI